MFTFMNQARQGDLYIKRIAELPIEIKAMPAQDGVYIVAHSESGHHHVINAIPGSEVFESEDPLTLYLRVINESEVKLEHQKTGPDAHKPILFPSGIFRIRIGRERTPEGWRRVTD